MKKIQIGLDEYPIDNDLSIIEAIKCIVIHHQGELSTLRIIDTCTHPLIEDQYSYDQMIDDVNCQNQPKQSIAEQADAQLAEWVNSGWSKDEVLAYPYVDEMRTSIGEMIMDANETMHYDDPSLINLYADLEKISKLLRK